MISSEMEELVEGSQRVVLRDGRSVAELSGEQKNTKQFCAMAEGADRRKPSVDSVKQSKTEYE